MKAFMLVAVLALGGGAVGCVSSARVEKRYGELEAAWRIEKATPSSTPLPDAVSVELKATAQAQVEAEVAKERLEAIAKGGEVAGRAAAGDYVGAFLALLGLGTAVLGAKS